MSKYSLITLWERAYPNKNEAYDYAGRKMLKAAIGDQRSKYCPSIDHIRPLTKGGKDVLGNISICNQATNFQKAESFPSWTANVKHFQAKRVKGTSDSYKIYQID